ncbi:lipoyl(octanoyl) transferase LipB [Sphingobium baderi]|uniref:Octanoyltransferase n=1 Tax=Sphingobium baderi LL03 TaxID=1114964 RepID=T0GLB2_9SPHN|nr:lipoyl(octanoyl) transferase LipB [Sphingobium baderi]EQB01497.1 lipoate-protein ligase B [Sphingobium baderi LL03]KMS60488.1 lipoate-protein ligase B [Sphingobium baderi LL03]
MTALPPSPSASDAADMVEWRVESAPVDYPEALADMEARAAAIFAGEAKERVWLLQHPPLYTAGTSADPAELLDPRFPVHAAGRGGRYTYHGPGQRIGYLNIDLRERGRDVRNFVHHLEGWMIAALGDLGIAARRAEGRIGIWTDDAQGREAKIGALGIRVRRWITLHGFSINVDPDLSHFGGIVPCGISAYPITSMAALGCTARMAELDAALRAHFPAFLARLGRCGAGVEQCETGR